MSVAFSVKADILGKDTRIVAIGIFFNGSREQFDDAGRVATQFFTDARDCGLMICDSAEIPVYLCYVPYEEPKAPRTAPEAKKVPSSTQTARRQRSKNKPTSSKVTHLPLNIGQSEAAHRRPEG